MKKPRTKTGPRPAARAPETAASPDPGTAAPGADSGADAPPAASPARPAEPALSTIPMLLAHFVWYLLGPLFLFLTLLGIVRAGSGWATLLDVVVVLVVGAMIYCRWLEQRSGQGMTTTGEPSTWEDFRRYSIGLSLLVAVLWIVANVLGNHWI